MAPMRFGGYLGARSCGTFSISLGMRDGFEKVPLAGKETLQGAIPYGISDEEGDRFAIEIARWRNQACTQRAETGRIQ